MNDPSGSRFRVWDLHVHTPASILENRFGSWDEYVAELFKRAISEEVAAVGITDYYSIAGYQHLREEYLEKPGVLEKLLGAEMAERARLIALFPNIELRVLPVLDGGQRANFHVLFSDGVDAQDIVQNFLGSIHFRDVGTPQGSDQLRTITEFNLKTLGARLKAEQAEFEDQPDIWCGMNNAIVDESEISRVLSQDHADIFRGRYLCGVSDSGAHNIRKVLVQKCDFMFSSSTRSSQWGLGLLGYSSPEVFRREFRGFKPCLWGSDAHDIDGLFASPGGKRLWVKANPTFAGLRQALMEPSSRIFVGSVPQQVKRQLGAGRSTAISSVALSRISDLPAGESWFGDTMNVPLNPGLVAIIGNKGTGKSALTDIIGLAGSTKRSSSFSFLNGKRFRASMPRNRASSFEASLIWGDGSSTAPIKLSDNPDDTKPELVQYLPQDFLESLCTGAALTTFEVELGRIVFDYLSVEEAGGQPSLDSLVKALDSKADDDLLQLRNSLHSLNEEIIATEHDCDPRTTARIVAELDEKRREARSLFSSRPSMPDVATASLAMLPLQRERRALETQDAGAQEELAKVRARLGALTALHQAVLAIDQSAKQVAIEHANALADLGQPLGQLLQVRVDTTVLDALITKTKATVDALLEEFDLDRDGSIAARLASVGARLEEVAQDLEGAEQLRSTYDTDLRWWRAEGRSMVGNAGLAGSLENLSACVRRSRTAPIRLRVLHDRRIRICRQIHQTLLSKSETRRQLYKPVQDFIDTADLNAGSNYEVAMAVGLVPGGTVDNLDNALDHSAAGEFSGSAPGRAKLDAMAANVEWDATDSVVGFTSVVHSALSEGQPPIKGYTAAKRVRGKKLVEFYDALFGLVDVCPMFKLTLGGKELSVLSPGERGALLLIFYLMIDESGIPLVIDQPEENLDNESVVEWLVGFLMKAREHRQVLLVTHNPNVAVVADADQVIHASIDRADGSRVSYLSGAIEDPLINPLLVNVLEGTMPAFKNRDGKYEISRLNL